MSVTVSFVTLGTSGITDAVGIAGVRVKEVVSVPGTTTAVAKRNEVVIVGNGEASMVAVAFGPTPDAAAVVATSATSAGYPIAAGQVSDPFILSAGDKVNIKVA